MGELYNSTDLTGKKFEKLVVLLICSHFGAHPVGTL